MKQLFYIINKNEKKGGIKEDNINIRCTMSLIETSHLWDLKCRTLISALDTPMNYSTNKRENFSKAIAPKSKFYLNLIQFSKYL